MSYDQLEYNKIKLHYVFGAEIDGIDYVHKLANNNTSDQVCKLQATPSVFIIIDKKLINILVHNHFLLHVYSCKYSIPWYSHWPIDSLVASNKFGTDATIGFTNLAPFQAPVSGLNIICLNKESKPVNCIRLRVNFVKFVKNNK